MFTTTVLAPLQKGESYKMQDYLFLQSMPPTYGLYISYDLACRLKRKDPSPRATPVVFNENHDVDYDDMPELKYVGDDEDDSVTLFRIHVRSKL
ncbi:hypothetical protein DFH09DRAFT_1302967 [Mycena vulgaris]|nr:hypothetical protein DFH09DRAFT_1319381 [Mycena vulgaris]KAJ6600504.1 hypothetical protein DFH09DRAFT_1302967 [Mycena vulgaris]